MSLTYAQFYLFYLLGNKNFWNVKKKRKRLSIRRKPEENSQLAFSCSNSIMKKPKQCVKSVQS